MHISCARRWLSGKDGGVYPGYFHVIRQGSKIGALRSFEKGLEDWQ
jgi:hypothetical protein